MAGRRDQIDRAAGRALFGRDAAGYERARPGYPGWVFEALAERCGLGPGTTVLEVGAGTGQATLPLLAAGARVTAIEPDAEMAARLRANAERAPGGDAKRPPMVDPGQPREEQPATTDEDRPAPPSLAIETTAFEDYDPPAARFDLAVAATSFHWVEPAVGLAKVHALLRPGGWWAMWWNVFGDEARPDPFHEATTGILGAPGQPGGAMPGRPPFALDRERRLAELHGAGFADLEVETMAWTGRLTTEEVRALYATFSNVAALPDAEREQVLDALATVAEESFGGTVERPFQTVVYTARRPATGG